MKRVSGSSVDLPPSVRRRGGGAFSAAASDTASAAASAAASPTASAESVLRALGPVSEVNKKRTVYLISNSTPLVLGEGMQFKLKPVCDNPDLKSSSLCWMPALDRALRGQSLLISKTADPDVSDRYSFGRGCISFPTPENLKSVVGGQPEIFVPISAIDEVCFDGEWQKVCSKNNLPSPSVLQSSALPGEALGGSGEPVVVQATYAIIPKQTVYFRSNSTPLVLGEGMQFKLKSVCGNPDLESSSLCWMPALDRALRGQSLLISKTADPDVSDRYSFGRGCISFPTPENLKSVVGGQPEIFVPISAIDEVYFEGEWRKVN